MIRIINDFYTDPDEVRTKALKSRYQLISNGNYPGKDSLDRMYVTPELESKIKRIFPDPKYQITCSRFRYALEDDTYMAYVHADSYGKCTGWHILIYLSDNKDVKDGLTLYKAPDGKKCWENFDQDYDWDFPLWTPWKDVEYKYNRAVIVDYSYFHAPMTRGGFGVSIENSRLLHIIEVINVESPANKNGIFSERVCMPENHHPYSRKDNNETSTWSDAETAAYERVEYLKY
jgi:hypothetical protein